MDKVELPAEVDGCWLWTGAVNNFGYGVIGTGGHRGVGYAHRLLYQDVVGEIPDGFVSDHVCCNPRCVNPDHIELVTQGENIRRGWATTRKKA